MTVLRESVISTDIIAVIEYGPKVLDAKTSATRCWLTARLKSCLDQALRASSELYLAWPR